jgi:hypothetical protein
MPTAAPAITEARHAPKMKNLDFLERYGRAGCIGLVGADTPIDRAIRGAQKNLVPGKTRSLWSHALIFQGQRQDGRLWVIESDVDPSKRIGVQENRIDKYADEKLHPNLGVLDLGLTPEQTQKVLGAALGFVASGAKYALGGILRTYAALLRQQTFRDRNRDAATCSTLVAAVFRSAGFQLAPGVALRHTAPEHLAQTELPHTRYLLVRQTP